MPRALSILVSAACLVIVGAALWPEREVSRPEPGREVSTRATPAPPSDTLDRAERPRPRDGAPAQDAVSTPGAATRAPRTVESRIATVRVALGEYMAARNERPIVDALIANGLSEADSERIVNRYNLDIAECTLEALRADAGARSESFEDLLAGLEMSLAGADVNVADVIDAERIERIEVLALPCGLDAMQRAGISPPGGR